MKKLFNHFEFLYLEVIMPDGFSRGLLAQRRVAFAVEGLPRIPLQILILLCQNKSLRNGKKRQGRHENFHFRLRMPYNVGSGASEGMAATSVNAVYFKYEVTRFPVERITRRARDCDDKGHKSVCMIMCFDVHSHLGQVSDSLFFTLAE